MSRASYTEERPLTTLKEVVFSSTFVILGFLVAFFSYLPLFTVIVPLSAFLLFFKDWKMLKKIKELISKGVITYEPKYRTSKREANRSLAVIILIILGPMILSVFLPPLPWISVTMAFVMAWPLSNVLEFILQQLVERETGGKLRKFYKWVNYGDEVLMKEYGWKIEK
ncbi:hypothetical protein [Sulfolobus acidocaldarius]|uniref:Membrane protein n=4 Tax=Sulfolobus acidocaldarius TaxID=2285 RepID=Q4J807_SULAC|nr:hypothetical protein [Sulfolobus acidocaldarius]AAY81072.1 membrane protein [Sulfolobus acidocaldarius DSM 639]AGE71679.1 membrane protein [Sulfolobus acidocaldarius N8]AGE73952.1 membrane protein [Sulfolobus acidocaldarius Ron12/I]ALU30110.1 hypothetical protein ATY89_09300 [Sulfolobus acidocaldarius]ALU30803.1 hypothetical protein ATZ20_00710 [Sulfolobus acidocaldarius]